ncbi:multidrug resistance protein homolog 49-like [Bacillus rossius redtenbacheri]|uniref:multidrug resistance protein homolog 49-like n=1 Tax=Bacillus rossius redtenbacheri TaxID=93214 RepID=UPI002FDC8B24
MLNAVFYSRERGPAWTGPRLRLPVQCRGCLSAAGIASSGMLRRVVVPDAPGSGGDAAPRPVAFYRLFRYATWRELGLTLLGAALGVASGCGMPLIIILYGEFTTLLVDRHVENTTSNPTALLSLYGGGRILVNGSEEQRHAYLLKDSEAFGVLCSATGLVQMVLGILSIACLNYSAQHQINRVRKLFLQAVMRQDMAWCDTNSTANFASQLTEDLDKLQEGIGEKIGIFMYLLSTFVSSVIMSFIHGWKLTLVVLSCAPVIIAATALVAKVQSSLSSKELESYGEAGAVAEEALSSIRTVVAFGGEEKEVERYSDKLQAAVAAGVKRGLFSGVGGGISWFIIYSSYAIAFWYGVDLILQDRDKPVKEYTPAILVIVLFGVLAGAMNMGLASPHIEAFAVARGAAAAVFAVVERPSGIDGLSDAGRKPPAMDGRVRLCGVHFNYPARPQVEVLQGLDLEVKRGETVALVGSSGCGKSTVLQLVQRLYDPLRGQVLIDGEDARELNVGWLRSHVGAVGQEPVLFAASIADNIRHGREGASQREVVEAARQANAHEFISKLPQGYDTLVGERGAQLSGGQKQRIAIARALVRNPRILLLDEATSALDTHSEAIVQDALDKARRGRTTLIVAHRLSTIVSADRIVYLSEGRVAEQGTHDELMALQGHYWSQVTAELTAASADQEHIEDGMKVPTDGIKSEIARRTSAHSLKKEKDVNFNLEQDDGEYDVPFARVMALTAPEWLCNSVGCLAALLVGSALPGFAVLFGEVYRVLSLVDVDEIIYSTRTFCILFVAIGLVTGFGTFFQMYAFGKAGVKLTSRLRVDTLQAVLRQEMGWFDDERNRVGVLCARLSGDAASVHGATGTRIGVILQSSATMVIGVVLGLYYSWKMTLVSLVSVPLIFGGIYGESKIIHSEGLQEKQALETATKIAVEAISNLRTVASLGAERLFIKRYEQELQVAKKAAAMKTRLRGFIFAFGQSSPFFGYALSLYYGGYLVATEGLPYENIIKVSEALLFGAWTLGQSLAYAPSASLAKLAAGRLFKLIDRKPLIVSVDHNRNWTAGDGGLEYSKVRFSYPARPGVPVLQGLDLLVQPGRSVALVGPSGCGKSTCVQLLQRFYDPASGSVSVNGTDAQDVPLRTLRSQLGLVSQEPTLFDRTIAENIAYGDNDRAVPMEEVIEAAKKANIHSFITSLPQGYDTRLGSKGAQLSGGQKQRIAIARALVRNPRILLLDEATSALDTHSQKVVQEALDKAQEGRTCITIAHRLVTVQQADVICVISQGVVAEAGSHAELLAKGGLYSQMVKQAAPAK